MQMYSEADVDTSVLEGKRIAILGYGSQGRAHALNLKDSGLDVIVGLRKSGASWIKAEADGLAVAEPVDAAKGSAIVMFLTPDLVQGPLYTAVESSIDQGAMLLFAHGFNIHFGQIVPPPEVDVYMVAPKGPGHLVRDTFVEGSGVPCLIALGEGAGDEAVHQEGHRG